MPNKPDRSRYQHRPLNDCPLPTWLSRFKRLFRKKKQRCKLRLKRALLKVGDVILLCDRKPGPTSHRIKHNQLKVTDEMHAKWIHCCIIVSIDGDDVYVIEADWDPPMTARVVLTKLSDYECTYALLVRRPSNVIDNDIMRARMESSSIAKIGMAYHWQPFLQHVLGEVFLNRPIDPTKIHLKAEADKYICSTLVAKVLLEVTGQTVEGTSPLSFVAPCHLSSTATLVDVEIEWEEVSYGPKQDDAS